VEVPAIVEEPVVVEVQ
jgi:hypothetical protein